MQKINHLLLIIVSLILCSCKPVAKTHGSNSKPEAAMANSKLYSFTMEDIAGQPIALSQYKGKVLLIVNVASKCGYTKQYAGLQELYMKYKNRGFVVLGFPANNFGGQEPGSNAEIKEFCSTKFSVTFPMFSKISVKGDDIHPLYKYLTNTIENTPFGGPIEWNFNKFLIGKNGKTIGRFPSATTSLDTKLIEAIESALNAAIYSELSTGPVCPRVLSKYSSGSYT